MSGTGAIRWGDISFRQNETTGRRRCGGRRRDLPRCRWAVAGPVRASRRGAERSEAASPRGRPDQGGPLTAASLARLEADAGPAGPGRASRRRTQPHASTPGTAGAEGASETCRGARGRWQGLDGLRGAAPNAVRPPSLAGGRTRAGRSQPQASPDWRPTRSLQGLAGLRGDAPSEARSADGERAGRPRGGRRSGGATSANGRNYSPARRSTSCMMRPHTALTHATAATPRTRERQGRICRKSSKP